MAQYSPSKEMTRSERIRRLDALYRAAIDARLAYGGTPRIDREFTQLFETIEQIVDLAGVVEMVV